MKYIYILFMLYIYVLFVLRRNVVVRVIVEMSKRLSIRVIGYFFCFEFLIFGIMIMFDLMIY